MQAKDKEGNLPLHSCVFGGHLEILKVLLLSCLEGGYVVSARNGEGRSALFLACRAASEALPSESIPQSIEDCSTTEDTSALERPREEAMVRRERAIGMALAWSTGAPSRQRHVRRFQILISCKRTRVLRGRANRGEMLSKLAAVVERSCRSRVSRRGRRRSSRQGFH